MQLCKLDVTEFTNVLASEAPAPGGGSTAALEGALGAALTAMVCALTAGKKAYAEWEAQTDAVRRRASALQARFLEVIDLDTEAFCAVSAACALPKATDEEKARRSEAIQKGLLRCTQSPFEMMELAAEALELAAQLTEKSNASAASDLGCAVLSLRAAICGAWLNVCINIGSLKDRAAAADYRARGQALLSRALPLADETYAAILAQITG